MNRFPAWALALMFLPSTWAAPLLTVFEATGATPASITAARDAFRVAVGGGVVSGANGSFGGARREVNWDGVPDARADPNLLPADFFNTTSPRGVVFSTPGSGFLVSANAGFATPVLFGFSGDFQTFSSQRVLTAVGSNFTDVHFFIPGTTEVATTTAFGLVFTGVEVVDLTKLDFFDETDSLIFSRSAMVSGNQGLSFLGATVSGSQIARVRITSGLNTILANGQRGNGSDDLVVMDDFIYAEPLRANAVPTPGTLLLSALALLACAGVMRSGAGAVRRCSSRPS